MITEFKKFFFPLDEKTTIKFKEAICAFMNKHGGRIYIGIDDDRKVKGITHSNNLTVINHYNKTSHYLIRNKISLIIINRLGRLKKR